MVRRIWISFYVVACFIVLGSPELARADMLAIDGGWKDFNWGANGLYHQEGPFTFTADAPVLLKVTDTFINGDRFEIYNFGSLLGTTSMPTNDGTYQSNPDTAYGDSRFSWGEWLLGPGSYSLTFKTIQFAEGHSQGTGYVRVDSDLVPAATTPEPGTLLMAGLGLMTLAGRRLRNYLRRRPESTEAA